MLAAVKVLLGNTVIIDGYIRAYDGSVVVVTLLDYPKPNRAKQEIDWDSFVISSEQGKNVEEYIKDMRENGGIKHLHFEKLIKPLN